MIRAVVWKEWRQQRMLVMGVVGLIAITMVVMTLTVSIKRGEFLIPSWYGHGGGLVAGVGAIFAIVLAAVTSGIDLRKGTDNFWRSRPVSEAKVFWVKFVMGAVVMLGLFLSLIFLDQIHLLQNWPWDQRVFRAESWILFCYTYPIAVAVFGVTLFAMVLTRDTAKAAMLATFFGLLLYFLPLLTSKLTWMNIFEQDNDYYSRSVVAQLLVQYQYRQPVEFLLRVRQVWYSTPKEYITEYAGFVLMMLGIGVGAVKGAIVAERRGWRWSPGQKEIVWGIGGFAAFIFGVSMFQIRHDLTMGQYNLAANAEKSHYFDWTDTPDVNNIAKRNLQNTYNFSREVYVSEKLFFNVGCSGSDKYAVYFTFGVYGMGKDRNVKAEPLSYVLFDELTRKDKQGSRASVLKCFVRGNIFYILYSNRADEDYQRAIEAEKSIYVLKVDISNPAEPRKIGTDTISIGKNDAYGIALAKDYCYFTAGKTLNVLKIGEAGLELCNKIEFAEWVPAQCPQIFGKMLLFCHPTAIAMFDINEPEHPRMVLRKIFQNVRRQREDITGGVAVKDGYLYYSTEKAMHVCKLIENRDGMYDIEEVGVRKATPIERLTGKNPHGLVFSNGMLVEAAGNFGLLVYDVSDPKRPRRVYHGETSEYIEHINVWGDRVYAYGGYPVLEYTTIPTTKR
jgi:hypothetical protein